MKRRSFKSATMGIFVFSLFAAISYTVFNLLVKLACQSFLYAIQNPLTSIFIIAGSVVLGFTTRMIYKKLK